MGGRFSRPRAPDGLTEIPKRQYGNINPRTVTAPLAALTMAALLYVYTRTSIRAAKLNAQKHREADGGQISWYKEGQRRHGTLEKVEDDRGTFKEALLGKRAGATPAVKDDQHAARHSAEEAKLSKLMGKDSESEGK